MKVVFMGSSDFGLPALEKLMESYSVAAVVSTPPKPQGRGLVVREMPIAAYARERRIEPIFTPIDLKDQDFLARLEGCHADVFIIVAFRILPKEIFSLPPLGSINIHASLLPKFRGPAPIQRAIEAGEKETGVTVFRIDTGIDTGAILLQKRLPIGAKETTPELYTRLSGFGATALMEALEGLQRGTIVPSAQDIALASRAPKLLKEESLIDWQRDAWAIFNKIRAFKPFPGTYALLEGRRLGIEWAEPVAKDYSVSPGTVAAVADSWFDVGCSRGALRVIEVKPEGRRSMSVRDFLLGNTLQEGMRLSWMRGA